MFNFDFSAFVPSRFNMRAKAVLVAFAMMFAPVTQANAFFLDPDLVEAKRHVFGCGVLLFQDVFNRTNNHLPECGVGEDYQARGAGVTGGVSSQQGLPTPQMIITYEFICEYVYVYTRMEEICTRVEVISYE